MTEPLPGHVITKVAERAQVSQRIVAMVLAGRSSVAPGTRNRVIAAIAEVGCAQHPAAAEAGVIGVLVDATSSYDHSPAVRAVADAALGAGLSTVVIGPGDADRILRTAPTLLIRVTPAGLIPAAADTPPIWPAPIVRLDHRTGGRLATRHLLDHGHRRVWHVAGPPDCPVAREREAGWRDALTEAGLEAPPVIRSDWSAAAGHAAGREVARRPECRAVFAADDQIALGVLRALCEAGRPAPGDVSVVGFDDRPESAFLSPPLTTIRLDLAAAARKTVGLLLGTRPAGPVVIDPVLVRRQSVAGAAAGRVPSRRPETSTAGR